jgi:hypothetical protein
MMLKFIRKFFSMLCLECKEVRVPATQLRCSLCDKGEGEIK